MAKVAYKLLEKNAIIECWEFL